MAGEVIPPPYVIAADDKRGLIVVTGAAVLSFIWCCFLIRVWLRLQTREWKSDDWWLAAATLLDTAQSVMIFHLVHLGLGASQELMTESQLERLSKEGFATQIIYIFVLLASKASVLFLYLRLSPGGAHRKASQTVVIGSCLWALIAVVLIAVPCNPIQAHTDPGSCTNRWPKWLTIGTLDILTELAIFLLSIHLVYSLQMRLYLKLLVLLAFSARLPVIAIATVRLYYLQQRLRGFTYTFEYIVVTQWQMGYAIMSSTITGMGPFLKPFEKVEYTTSYYNGKQSRGPHSGAGVREIRTTDSRSSESQSYLMQSLPSRRGSRREQRRISLASSADVLPLHGGSPSSQAPIMTLTADEHFCPADVHGRHETEIWAGERSRSRSRSVGRGEAAGQGEDAPKLVIGKKKEFKIEVDRIV